MPKPVVMEWMRTGSIEMHRLIMVGVTPATVGPPSGSFRVYDPEKTHQRHLQEISDMTTVTGHVVAPSHII